ncbi:hypothetical protein B0H11DRAFT_1899628 [Mycena galericulata]|nr:hypothetical protein B0H11DRAFT_1899628 [Mycena galericulata]
MYHTSRTQFCRAFPKGANGDNNQYTKLVREVEDRAFPKGANGNDDRQVKIGTSRSQQFHGRLKGRFGIQSAETHNFSVHSYFTGQLLWGPGRTWVDIWSLDRKNFTYHFLFGGRPDTLPYMAISYLWTPWNRANEESLILVRSTESRSSVIGASVDTSNLPHELPPLNESRFRSESRRPRRESCLLIGRSGVFRDSRNQQLVGSQIVQRPRRAALRRDRFSSLPSLSLARHALNNVLLWTTFCSGTQFNGKYYGGPFFKAVVLSLMMPGTRRPRVWFML